jgi:hypothetical protein
MYGGEGEGDPVNVLSLAQFFGLCSNQPQLGRLKLGLKFGEGGSKKLNFEADRPAELSFSLIAEPLLSVTGYPATLAV